MRMHFYTHKQINMKKETKIIAGVLAGAALGAAVALILSNDRSGEMKDKMSEWFSDLLELSKDKLADVTDQIKDTIANAKA